MNLRIALLCNDRLAFPALQTLIASGKLVAVGMPATAGEIKVLVQQLCKTAHIPFKEFPQKHFGQDLLQWVHDLQPDAVFVKTFPWKIPAAVLKLPAQGFINFHYAPLPMWRGPNPLFWMVRNNITTGGVSVHRMDENFDTGPVLLHQPFIWQSGITLGMLHTQLAYAGVEATQQLMQALVSKTIVPQPQDNAMAGWYKRPRPTDLVIDWQLMPAAEVLGLVKACNPWNKGAATSWKGWHFGITDATALPMPEEPAKNEYQPGTIVEMNPVHGMLIACCDQQLIRAEVVYCEEGFYPGYRLAAFGLLKNQRLGAHIPVMAHC